MTPIFINMWTKRTWIIGIGDQRTLMPFGRFHNAESQFDICTTPGHICSYHYVSRLPCLRNHLCFLCILPRVEHLMFDFFACKHSRKQFRRFNRNRTHQHRQTLFVQMLNFIDHSIVFFALGAINKVIKINAAHRFMCRNSYHIEFVNLMKLFCLCLSRTRHACQPIVEPEIILKRNRRHSLCIAFNFHLFFRFNSLMQPIGITSTRLWTTCKFIDNHNLATLNHVLHIFFIQRIRLQQFSHTMDRFILLAIILIGCFSCLVLIFGRQRIILFNICKHYVEIWQHKIIGFSTDLFTAFFRQINDMAFFINTKIKIFIQLMRALVANIIGLNPLYKPLDTFFLKPLHEALVFGHPALHLQ